MSHLNFKAESLRLQGFDYSAEGAYFITICSFERKNTFGKIVNSKFVESSLGSIIRQELLKTNDIRHNVFLGSWVIMPNHLHAIIYINNSSGVEVPTYEIPNYFLILNSVNSIGKQSKNLSSFVRGFKASVTSKARALVCHEVWQNNYFERIIRSQNELINIENYINENILNWDKDTNNVNK